MIAPIEDVAEPPLPLPSTDVDSSYAVLSLVLAVGGWRMAIRYSHLTFLV